MTLAIFTAPIGNYHDARYRHLAKSGVQFTVLATQNEPDFVEFMATGNATYPTQRLYAGRDAYREACVAGRVWPDVHARLTALDPSVVAVAGWASPASFAAIAWARRHHRRLVMLSDSQSHDFARSAWRERVKARVVRLSDAALVGGPSHLNYAVQLGLCRERVFMGYDAVDNAHFSCGAEVARAEQATVRGRLGMPRRYLLASARFIPKKNLPRLVAAYGKALRGRVEAPDLVILGDGPQRGDIETAIAVEGLVERIHLRGFRKYCELPAIYALSEGLVHVSTSEQWGLVINEAAAAGVPILASSACGATVPLVEDNVTGFVVDSESKDSIALGLTKLMDLDEARRHEMGRAAQIRVADWGLERFTNGLVAACRAAQACQSRGLMLWDSALLRVLARQPIGSVQ